MTRRIERDPEPWEFSEDNFRYLEASLLRAELRERHEDRPGITWSAIKGAVIGVSISLMCWWGIISFVLWVKGW